MARGANMQRMPETRNKFKSEENGSDASDEDYMVGEDEEFIESDDEDCSLVEDDSDDTLGQFVVDEEEEDRVKKKVAKPGWRKGSHRRNTRAANPIKNKVAQRGVNCDDTFSGSKPKTKNRFSCHIEENDGEDLNGWEANGFDVNKTRNKSKLSCTEMFSWACNEKPRKKCEASYQEEDGGCEYDDSDEEFTLDEVEDIDEEELLVTKKNKTGKLRRMEDTQICRSLKRKMKHRVLKIVKRKKPMKEKVPRERNRSHQGEFSNDENQISLEKRKISKPFRRKIRKQNLDSDSDFMNSGSRDYEYTVSEEEREQVREASKFCGTVTSNLRSSNALKLNQEEESVPIHRKCLGRKGKEKVVNLQVVVGKQVCGICLSEEGERTVRGILNCCSHYFCFTCIMEWSKVESRCPLCKKRFATVCRTLREDGGHYLRDSVIQVPERDQVYQPSEEELRGYLDPYENVLCTECQQGGDDALMLLCDICDSPAHSYCVGLGREVPEGNWYCDGCRPTALASSNAQPLNSDSNPGANNTFSVGSSPVANIRETFDLNELYVPETPLSQAAAHSPSPRQFIVDIQAAPPGSGSGAFTLFERRRIQRQIQQLLHSRNRQLDSSDGACPSSTISLFGSQISRNGLVAPQQSTTLSRMSPQNMFHDERLSDNATFLSFCRDSLSPRLSSLRGQVLHNQASMSGHHSFDRLSQSEFVEVNARIGRDLGHLQHPSSSASNTGSDSSMLPFQFREGPVPSRNLQGHLHTPI